MAKKRDGELISSIKVIVGLLYFFLIFVCFFYLDKLLFNWIQSGSDSSFYNKLAGFFSAYGRLEWSTLLISFIFLIFAIDLKNRRKYLNLAKICFLGGILAGISVWPPKTILGRERPRGVEMIHSTTSNLIQEKTLYSTHYHPDMLHHQWVLLFPYLWLIRCSELL